ncbi:ABC transporter ATP-binding protein [Phyllobacterium sp. 0TCS1.6C]|uniref:ABC transporter ATP-binding protein n=1 Tax=unclassified Phyllobacterium TaxID=2638441 RepID=UPI00226462E4|nr:MULTISPECIES: ABC transporter ATP-binding protein [unclassified Phyllobacterium]MCX8282241.1 ABC transporter ATP-binding protein [Phyllobacterium sp. 0TCS1.6C]MCX8294929.1 ABC transporter ATP-binding protein [Phyllobacterium sp. 0TCS1.6A]
MTGDTIINSSDTVLLRANGLTKIFGTLKACDDVDLVIARGEIHALLGENGAGKSTLVKMLFGALQPTLGSIAWKGEAVTIPSPSVGRTLGIGMVFQHFSLFDALTAAENIALSIDEATPIGMIAEKARQIGKAYGLPVDPDALVGDLSVGERQRIEIIRCLLQNPDLIILDEPTSVLTPQEAELLFVTLERLRSEGKSILYISHRLEEVRQLCDRATVLRHGKVVGECNPREQTANSLARMMVGGDIHRVEREPLAADAAAAKAALIEVKGLSQRPTGPFSVALHDIGFTVHAGEILGIAGVAGNGQSELFEAVSGERLQERPDIIRIRAIDAGRQGISARRKLGAAFVPEERLGHGAVPDMSLSDNLLLSRHATDRKVFTSGGVLKLISASSLTSAARRIISRMDVRKSAENPDASALSGGNLQKFLIGRELDRNPSVLVVNQPTWGVDAGAAAHIRQALVDLARGGSAVIVISQDLDELFEISDRIAAMVHGRLSDSVPIEEMNMERVGMMMGGADHSAPEAA